MPSLVLPPARPKSNQARPASTQAPFASIGNPESNSHLHSGPFLLEDGPHTGIPYGQPMPDGATGSQAHYVLLPQWLVETWQDYWALYCTVRRLGLPATSIRDKLPYSKCVPLRARALEFFATIADSM